MAHKNRPTTRKSRSRSRAGLISTAVDRAQSFLARMAPPRVVVNDTTLRDGEQAPARAAVGA
jgi:hypothetical protein